MECDWLEMKMVMESGWLEMRLAGNVKRMFIGKVEPRLAGKRPMRERH